eukprot:gene31063-37542_t
MLPHWLPVLLIALAISSSLHGGARSSHASHQGGQIPVHTPDSWGLSTAKNSPASSPAYEVAGRGDLKPSQSSSSPSYQSDWSQLDKDVVFEGLKRLYRTKVLPLELASQYAQFASPPLGPSDFDAKPMVLVLGQYSV